MGDKIPAMNWPKKGDKAFIGEITPHSPVHAYIDWLKYGHYDYISKSFKEAGDMIVNTLEGGGSSLHADIYFFRLFKIIRGSPRNYNDDNRLFYKKLSYKSNFVSGVHILLSRNNQKSAYSGVILNQFFQASQDSQYLLS